MNTAMYNMLDFVKEKYSLKSVQLFESYTYLPKKCMYSSLKSTFFPPATSYKEGLAHHALEVFTCLVRGTVKFFCAFHTKARRIMALHC